MRALSILVAGCLSCSPPAAAQTGAPAPAEHGADHSAFTTVSFPAADGLAVTADLYMGHPESAPFIVLFHQAGWSRGEYREIAPRLVSLGFNCMAVDQRSGGEVSGVVNETHRAAERLHKDTTFTAALADMEAALSWARSHHAKGKLIAWGSSYSAALVLRLAGEPERRIDAALAFAPGEYFVRFGKPKDWVRSKAAAIAQPVFITSAKDEKPKWEAIYQAIASPRKVAFVPNTKGNHGSRALWRKFADSPAYWAQVEKFLAGLKGP